jgi:hypothetical protein
LQHVYTLNFIRNTEIRENLSKNAKSTIIAIISISNKITIGTITATIIAISTIIAIKQNNHKNHKNCNNQNNTCLPCNSTIPKNVVDQMNNALVQNMDLLDKQAIPIHSE